MKNPYREPSRESILALRKMALNFSEHQRRFRKEQEELNQKTLLVLNALFGE